MRIIGIDPGLARVGYGIIEIENEKKILLQIDRQGQLPLLRGELKYKRMTLQG